MKRSLAIGAAIFSLAILTIQDASAQRGGGMGGGGGGARMGGGGFGGGGVRMGGPGFGGGGVRMGGRVTRRFVWERPASVGEPSMVVPALALGEARGSMAGLAPAFARQQYAAAMWVELDGQAASVPAMEIVGTEIVGTAIEGGDGVGASQSRRQQSASVTMPEDMDMMTAASLGMAISG